MNLPFNHRRVIPIYKHFSNLIFGDYKKFYSTEKLPFYIGGGSIRSFISGEGVKTDLDLIPKSLEGRENLLRFISENNLRRNFIIDVHKIEPSMEVFSGGVTYTLASGCLDDEKLVFHPDLFTHIAERRVSFNPHQTMAKTPQSAIKRAFRYAKYGYYFEEKEITKILNHFNLS